MNLNFSPGATTALHILEPAERIFEAFVGPEAVSRLWAASRSGCLDIDNYVAGGRF